MEKTTLKRRAYIKPEIEIMHIETEGSTMAAPMMTASFGGGHSGGVSGGDSGDSGDNGHGGAESGGGVGDAKRGFFDLDGWGNTKGGSIWED